MSTTDISTFMLKQIRLGSALFNCPTVQSHITTRPALRRPCALSNLPCPIGAERGMKRAAKPKKPREKLPDYCDVQPLQDEHGDAIWPAPLHAMQEARAFIKEWYANFDRGSGP